VVVNNVSPEQSFAKIKVKRSWAYTTRVRENGTENMASIRAAQANTLLLLAYRRPDNQFTVS
jgi:hypothetical protein